MQLILELVGYSSGAWWARDLGLGVASAPRRGRQDAIPNPPPHASPCLWVQARERRPRHAGPAALSRAQEHPAHRPVHRNGARPLQGFLEGLRSRAWWRWHLALLGLRSFGPTAVSAASMILFGRLALGGSTGAGSAVVSTASPSISLAWSPARAASDAFMCSIMASSCSSGSETALLCSILCSRGTSKAKTFRYAPGCVRRTFAMRVVPCSRKSRSSAQMTASLNALREPRGRPAGFPIGDFRIWNAGGRAFWARAATVQTRKRRCG